MTSCFAHRLWRFCIALFALGVVCGFRPAAAQESILPGWGSYQKGKVTVYKPKDLPDGREGAFEVRPAVDVRGKDLEAVVLAEAADGEKSHSEVIAKEKPVRAKEGDFEVLSVVHLYGQYVGDKIFVFYLVAHQGNGSARLARLKVSADEALAKKYVPAAMDALETLTKADRGKPLPKETYVDPAEADKVRLKKDLYTALGKGPKQSEVLGIYSATLSSSVPKPIVILTDGTYYEDFDVPVEDFDVEAARRIRPETWGKWRRKEGVFQVKDRTADTWKNAKWYGPIPGAKPDTTLDGNYTYSTGSDPTAATVYRELRFYSDGRFVMETTSRIPGGVSYTPGYTTTTLGASKSEGTYTLNGHTLTLKFGDGRVERRTFAYMDKERRPETIYLNGYRYLQNVIQ